MKRLILVLLAALPLGAFAVPITVDFEINTSTTTVGSFTFDSSLDGGTIGYADLDAFSITLWTGSTYDLAFINTGTYDFLEFAFDSSSDTFLDVLPASGVITAIRTNLTDGFWVAAPSGICAGTTSRCVADYPGPVYLNGGEFDTITVRRAGGMAVPEPAALGLVGLGLAGLGFTRKRVS